MIKILYVIPNNQSLVQTRVSTITSLRELRCWSNILLLMLKADLEATVKIKMLTRSRAIKANSRYRHSFVFQKESKTKSKFVSSIFLSK